MKCSMTIFSIVLINFGLYVDLTSAYRGTSCPPLHLQNGRVRARARGKIVRFLCLNGYTLVGYKYTTCIRGQWNTPPPVCVSTACPALPKPDHTSVIEKFNGAVMMYFCEPGYTLFGYPEIYCDGKQWNSTAPYCKGALTNAPRSCDFEKDLCEWEQDPIHDFDWRRHNFETPSAQVGTGPSHDHTFGKDREGYYLYIEASGRLQNDTARIFSPIYNASLTEAGCFSFWYHMYGATTGALNIYFKPETDEKPTLMFTKAGNQGNEWLSGVFALPKSKSHFQLIIEGVRGSSYVSDIAIDDIAVLQGIECQANWMNSTNVTDSDDDQVEAYNAQLTCRNRCSDNTSNSFTVSSMVPPASPDGCQCTIDCADNATCCPDYAEYCVLDYSITPLFITTVMTAAPPLPTLPPTIDRSTPKPPVQPPTPGRPGNPGVPPSYPNRNNIPTNSKDDIDPNPPKKAETSSVIPPIPPRATSAPSTSPITIPPRATSVPSTSPTTTTLITPKPTRKLKPTLPPKAKESPFDTTTVQTGHIGKQTDTIGTGEQMNREVVKETSYGITAIVCSTLAAMIVVTVVAVVVIKKRRNYKRKAGGSSLSEDSDVRYLTSDEMLDLNLARPSDSKKLRG